MVRSIRRARLTYVSLACLALALAFAGHEVRAADLDPQALLGEWQGTWAMAASRSSTGNYYITINKVEGNKVHGRSERPATGKSGESNWNFVGTLAENVVIVPDLAEAPVLQALAWPAILVANLLAATAMGGFFWLRHPNLRVQP